MKISTIIPTCNEEENIHDLYIGLTQTLAPFDGYEIIFINDGSTDDTLDKLHAIQDSRIRVLSFTQNRGQSMALSEGIRHARGDLIVTMDADLQNNPEDIKKLVQKIGEGYDAVFGVRVNRQDSRLRKLQATLANWVANILLGEEFTDRGCSLKCFKSRIVKDLPFFDGMHRFYPTLLRRCRTAEVEVEHYPRLRGKTKVRGFRRAFKAFRDALYVKKLIKKGTL
jgi:glycosyltransferase involved in cell wall biosynthesis